MSFDQQDAFLPQSDYIDITHLLVYTQEEAASMLGIPPSTLSKRWQEAVGGRRTWPHRKIKSYDAEIEAILINLPISGEHATAPVPGDLCNRLCDLLTKRQNELAPVVIRISKK